MLYRRSIFILAIFCLGLAGCKSASPAKVAYSHTPGLSFDYPSTWQLPADNADPSNLVITSEAGLNWRDIEHFKTGQSAIQISVDYSLYTRATDTLGSNEDLVAEMGNGHPIFGVAESPHLVEINGEQYALSTTRIGPANQSSGPAIVSIVVATHVSDKVTFLAIGFGTVQDEGQLHQTLEAILKSLKFNSPG